MTSILGIPFALMRLLLTDWRLTTTNSAVIWRVFSNLGRTNLRVLILPLLLLCVALMPVRILYWAFALPYNLMTLASNLKRERHERKLADQGANIYPLW